MGISQTKSPVLQYNEYYPFGMQTMESWTRENTTNQFLYNSGTELNGTTGLYDLAFRNYDPVLGRFAQVDPLADQYGGLTPYNYAANDPVYFNDPRGLSPNGKAVCLWCGGPRPNDHDYPNVEGNDYGAAFDSNFSHISTGIDVTDKSEGYFGEGGQEVYPEEVRKKVLGNREALRDYGKRYGEGSISFDGLSSEILLKINNALTYGSIDINGNSLIINTVAVSSLGGQLSSYTLDLVQQTRGGPTSGYYIGIDGDLTIGANLSGFLKAGSIGFSLNPVSLRLAEFDVNSHTGGSGRLYSARKSLLKQSAALNLAGLSIGIAKTMDKPGLTTSKFNNEITTINFGWGAFGLNFLSASFEFDSKGLKTYFIGVDGGGAVGLVIGASGSLKIGYKGYR